MTEFIPTLESRIYQLINSDDYRPLKQHEIAAALKIKASAVRRNLRQALRDLEDEGKIRRIRKNRWAPIEHDKRVMTGRLRVNPGRFGFVTPEEAGIEDVYVPEEGLGVALDGDRVVVCLSGSTAPTKRGRRDPRGVRQSGRITRILERGREAMVGLLCKSAWYWYVIPDNPRLIHTVRVRDFDASANLESHKVRIQLDEWTDAGHALSGTVIEDLGPADAPGVDILSIIRDHALDIEFPEDALEEAERHVPSPPAEAYAAREDIREATVFTIDPADAKDFDDAVSIKELEGGAFLLGVHIADVSHFVRPATPLDREAFLRGNSVYLVDRTLPMLPAHLTTEVCSLRAGRDRLTHSVEIEYDARGHIRHSRTFPSVIRSSARLTYEQVQRVFDGGQDPDIPPPVAKALTLMRTLAAVLRRRRINEGSIELAMPEIRCVLDDRGVPVELSRRGASEAYHLIEEFMLAANRVVASLFAKSERPAIYRVHPPPDARQWGQMQLDLNALGIRTSVRSRDALNEVARDTAETPSAHVAHLAILRNLKRAEYSPTLAEHFGLAFACYTHFTSPIRRYPDLVVHRMLKALEQGCPSPADHEEAGHVAAHCSQTERNAAEAEEESLNVKRIEYYRRLLEKKQVGPFKAVVVSLIPKGLMVELTGTFQRGLVPFHSLGDDHYKLDHNGTEARGKRRGSTWRVGRFMEVMLSRVDVVRRRVDFYPAPREADRAPVRRGAGKRRKRAQRMR